MNILVITQYFWPESFRINDMALGLKERGHNITVLTGYPNYPSGRVFDGYNMKLVMKEDYSGIEIIRIPIFTDHSLSKRRRIANYLSYVCSASLLGPIFCRKKVDKIIVFQPGAVSVGVPAMVFSLINKSPIFFWVQDLWPEALVASDMVESKLVLNIVRRLSDFLYKKSYKVLIQSEGFRSVMESRGIEPEKIEYLPNWAESVYTAMPYNKNRKQAEGMEGFFNVLYAGNIGVFQDFDVILETARLLSFYKDIQLVILGDGALLGPSLQKVKYWNINNIVFKGRKPVEEVPLHISLADVLLVQLKSNPFLSLTIPSKIQSYLSSGKPIIGAIEGYGAKVIHDAQCGITCKPGDPEVLKEVILAMYKKSKDELGKMGANGREYYLKHFERNIIIDRFEKILEEKCN